jgi:uncharacterized protein (TIGR04255 family)
VKLNRPPVIQSWIGFTFEPAPQKRSWDLQAAQEFLGRYSGALPHIEAIFSTNYEIAEISPTDRPEITRREVRLDHIRARNSEGTRWVQLADDQLVCNVTRGGGEYPHYPIRRDESLSKLSDYIESFQPVSVRRAELHYVDLIEIPIPPEGQIKLEDYFNLRVEAPQDFGMTYYYAIRVFLRPPVDGDTLEVRFQTEPSKSDTKTFRFRMDWNMVCANIATLDRDLIVQRLDDAHACLWNYFRASFTEKTWDLFQPSESE